MELKNLVIGYRSKNPIIKWVFLKRIYIAIELAKGLLSKKPESSIIDIGCGEGILLAKIYKKYPNISMLGIDIEREILTLKEKIPAEFKLMSVTDMNLKDDSFDVAFCLDMLEHLTSFQLNRATIEIKRVLKPKGILITSLPTETAFYKLCRLFFLGTTSAQDGPCSPHFHTAKQVETVLRSSGFKQIEQKLIPQVPFFSLFHITSFSL